MIDLLVSLLIVGALGYALIFGIRGFLRGWREKT